MSPSAARARTMGPRAIARTCAKSFDGFVLSFDGSAKTDKHGGLTGIFVYYLDVTIINFVIAAGVYFH